jgi:hypothetical protein
MPQPRNATPTPDAAPTLETGQHNPYLAGLLVEGEKTEAAIKEWFKRRDTLRSSARDAVKTGFCSPEQKTAVEKLWPFPKRAEKKDGEDAAKK